MSRCCVSFLETATPAGRRRRQYLPDTARHHRTSAPMRAIVHVWECVLEGVAPGQR